MKKILGRQNLTMKKIILSLLVLTSFALAGCGAGKDAEVNDFVAESEKLAKEIVQKVKANPTTSGVEEAQKVLDAKKSELKAKYDRLKTVSGYEIKDETMKKFTDSTFKNIESVNGLKIDFAEKTFDDEAFSEKINKLVTDYNNLYGV